MDRLLVEHYLHWQARVENTSVGVLIQLKLAKHGTEFVCCNRYMCL